MTDADPIDIYIVSSPPNYREVKRALLDADVNLKVTNALLEAVKEKALGTFCSGGSRLQ